MSEARDNLVRQAGRLLGELRAKRPLVQNITNFVSMDIAANVLLAVGASPAMVHAPEESRDFLTLAQALVINIGTLSSPWVESMEVAAKAARSLGKPWVLDPVGAGATGFRDSAVKKLIAHRPQVIRGNASEIMAVARVAGLTQENVKPKGVDSQNSSAEAEDFARALAIHLQCTIAATGTIDFITDGTNEIRLANGSPLMARVTAVGCSLSALVGAFVGIERDAFVATQSALAIYGVAGEMAGEMAIRPGSFRTAFIDALDAIGPDDLQKRLQMIESVS
jgi:hydroxyethylthiazole kinase